MTRGRARRPAASRPQAARRPVSNSGPQLHLRLEQRLRRMLFEL